MLLRILQKFIKFQNKYNVHEKFYFVKVCKKGNLRKWHTFYNFSSKTCYTNIIIVIEVIRIIAKHVLKNRYYRCDIASRILTYESVKICVSTSARPLKYSLDIIK